MIAWTVLYCKICGHVFGRWEDYEAYLKNRACNESFVCPNCILPDSQESQ